MATTASAVSPAPPTEHEITVFAPTTPLSPSIPNAQTLHNVTALARFEFEPGKGNDGTKIMMVEWQDEDPTRSSNHNHKDNVEGGGRWTVSWQGKTMTSFPADDEPTVDNIRRLYFLLPPGQIVPPHVVISYVPASRAVNGEVQSDREADMLSISVNPLPAIFTPELGATAKASGKKGVLHTIWAKKRLQVLDDEIRKEQEYNLEGVALEMALEEKLWIEENFGLGGEETNGGVGDNKQKKKPGMVLDLAGVKNAYSSPPLSPALQSPKSPGGGRLSEKLKGLSLGTSDRDLMGRSTGNTPTRELHPLSPEVGDVAVSSFGAFRDAPASTAGQNQSQNQQKQAKRVVAEAPPDHIRQQQQSATTSLNFMSQSNPQPFKPASAFSNDLVEQKDDPDDLFAIALNPRAPNDPKSPFSDKSDVGAFAKIKGSVV